MQAYVNEALIKKRVSVARYAGIAGFGALVAGLFTVSSNLFLSYVFLIVGLIAATVASYMTNQYVKEPRGDRVFQRVLAGLDKRYALYSYYLPASHVVASHHGLTVLLARPQRGVVTVQGGRWQHKSGWRRILQFFGEPGLGRPDADLQHEMQRVAKWISERLPEVEIPVTGVVVFTHPEVELHVSDAQVPVMLVADLPRFFREDLRDAPILSTAVQKDLRRTLDKAAEQAGPVEEQ